MTDMAMTPPVTPGPVATAPAPEGPVVACARGSGRQAEVAMTMIAREMPVRERVIVRGSYRPPPGIANGRHGTPGPYPGWHGPRRPPCRAGGRGGRRRPRRAQPPPRRADVAGGARG